MKLIFIWDFKLDFPLFQILFYSSGEVYITFGGFPLRMTWK